VNQVSKQAKDVARQTSVNFGIMEPPIYRHWDDDHRQDIHVLEAADRPQIGVTSYATVGLSEYPIVRNGEELKLGVELLGACSSAYPGFEKVMATLGFCIINSKWFCAPGVIFPGAINMYDISSTMSDIYFANQYLWGDNFKSMSIDGKTIAWLLAVPVSKQESEFANRYGPEKLEKLFADKGIDIFDLNRVSVVS